MFRYVRFLGLGPLLVDTSASDGTPTGDPAPGTPPPDPSGGGGGAPIPEPQGESIPYARFAQVNAERSALLKEKEEREAVDQKAKGEHEKLYETEKGKREAAEARVLSIARRSAFIGVAAATAADPEAAFKLASADGMLDDVVIDENGSADPKVVAKIVEDLLKRYEFLRAAPKDRNFGDPKDGQTPAPSGDLSKLSTRQMLELGFTQSSGRTRS